MSKIEIKNNLKNEDLFIKNLQYELDGYKINVSWDWPNFSTNINYIYAFEVLDENETIDSYIERKAKIILIPRNSNDKFNFSYTFKENFIQFVFFPAIIIDDNVSIISQQMGNMTKKFHKRIILNSKILYKNKFLFWRKKQAQIEIINKDKIKFLEKDALNYYVYRINDKKIIAYYPLDLDWLENGKVFVNIEKDFKIELVTNIKYKDSIIIKY